MSEHRCVDGTPFFVDDCDDAFVASRKWSVLRSKNKRAVCVRSGNGQYTPQVYLHRGLLNPPEGVFVDHIDGDGLNNRRANLRFCDKSRNSMNRGPQRNNTSGFKGVSWRSRGGVWAATITVNGRRKEIGYYRDRVDAARAYNAAAVKLHGEFAWLNQIPEAP